MSALQLVSAVGVQLERFLQREAVMPSFRSVIGASSLTSLTRLAGSLHAHGVKRERSDFLPPLVALKNFHWPNRPRPFLVGVDVHRLIMMCGRGSCLVSDAQLDEQHACLLWACSWRLRCLDPEQCAKVCKQTRAGL